MLNIQKLLEVEMIKESIKKLSGTNKAFATRALKSYLSRIDYCINNSNTESAILDNVKYLQLQVGKFTELSSIVHEFLLSIGFVQIGNPIVGTKITDDDYNNYNLTFQYTRDKSLKNVVNTVKSFTYKIDNYTCKGEVVIFSNNVKYFSENKYNFKDAE